MRCASCSVILTVLLTLIATTGEAKRRSTPPTLESPTGHVDAVGIVDGSTSVPRKVLQDTVWIADWTFDTGSPCSDSGWERVDLRVLSDGQLYWDADIATFDDTGGITGQAAVLGHDDPSYVQPGYDNNWYQAIRIEYTGASTLSFDYLLDSEKGWDFLRVELDSACTSLSRVDYTSDPVATAAAFRTVEYTADGLVMAGRVESLPIDDFGTSETHCLYIAFSSDIGWSPADGLVPTTLGIALAVDNVELSGGVTLFEDFETSGAVHPALSFENIQAAEPFGNWARLYDHITDNSFCTENTSCAWLFTDDTTPTIANDPSMAFGPGGFVVRNWLDNAIVSPWVSLASTPNAQGTILQYRIFGGNSFATSRFARNSSVRGRLADGVSTGWRGWSWWSLGFFTWGTSVNNMTGNVELSATDLQARIRVSDIQYIWGWDPPQTLMPGPGPYVDRVRIGRIVLSGPAISRPGGGAGSSIFASKLAQDAFPTEIHPDIPPGTGEHYRPSTDRFGTAAFSMGFDLSGWPWGPSPNLITGDSVVVVVEDQRGAGGITSVEWYGAIVAGPHAGKAPPPWSVGANGFFMVPPVSVDGGGWENVWAIDLDDDYFRGGDKLHYFWIATDALNGVTSDPRGLTSAPASIEEAQLATGGLWEVSFLPTIDWDPGYLSRIAADPHGKLEPTAQELAGSAQANCILYVNATNLARRSGDINRTSFMYTLDRLGYRDHYDVYDHMGLGSAHNELGGRATLAQAQGYALIIHDSGLGNGGIPFGVDTRGDPVKVPQSDWYQNWLANAVSNDAGTATLWVIGANMAQHHQADPLLFGNMGVSFVTEAVNIDLNPEVEGQTSFTFENGNTVDFANDAFTLNAGCPWIHEFDGIDASGEAVLTHRFQKGVSVAEGAAVMNRNTAESWNTILMTFPWFDIVDAEPASPEAEEHLLSTVLGAVLPNECLQQQDPTDADDPDVQNVPRRTVLHQNTPNPFNPTTTIRFDLRHEGPAKLRIYDVAGRLVRTLVDDTMRPGAHRAVWDGQDDAGRTVSSGVYLYQLVAGDFRATRKLVVLQ